MSDIKIYSLTPISSSVILNFGKVFGYEININGESEGFIRINTTPNLSAAHKTSMQKMIDAVGFGSITP